MKTILRVVGIGFAALLVLLGAAAAFVASDRFDDFVKAQAVQVMHERYQRSLRIDGPLVFSFYPRLGLGVAGVSLSEHGSTEEFAAFDSARIEVAIAPLFSRQVVVDACELRGLRATVVRRKDGTLNIDDLLAPQEPAGAPLLLDIAALRLGAAQLVWRDERDGGGVTLRDVELAGDRVRMETGSKALTADRLALAATLAGAARPPARASLAASGVAGSPEKLEVQRLALDFDAAAGETHLKGTLASPFAADIAGRSLALGELSGRIDVAHPRLKQALDLPLAGTLRADLRRQSAAGRLSARLDESKLALKLAVSRFSPLRLVFELDIDRLDVDRYVKPAPNGRLKTAKPKSGAPAAADLDISGTLRIGSLSIGTVKASKVALRVASADGRLDTDILKALGGN